MGYCALIKINTNSVKWWKLLRCVVETGKFPYPPWRTCKRDMACFFEPPTAQSPRGSVQRGRCRGPGENFWDPAAPWQHLGVNWVTRGLKRWVQGFTEWWRWLSVRCMGIQEEEEGIEREGHHPLKSRCSWPMFRSLFHLSLLCFHTCLHHCSLLFLLMFSPLCMCPLRSSVYMGAGWGGPGRPKGNFLGEKPKTPVLT